MTAISIDPLQFWGKASPSGDEAERFHPLVFHALDVAAVFGALTEADAELLGILASSFAASGERIVATLTVLVALHDIGKVSKKIPGQKRISVAHHARRRLCPTPSSALRSCSGRLRVAASRRIKTYFGEAARGGRFRRETGSAVADRPSSRNSARLSSEWSFFARWDGDENADLVADATLSAFDISSVSSLPPISARGKCS